MANRFLALDIETANSSYSSICQIGIVAFENGEVVEKFKTYIDPEQTFDPINIYIHGINSETVKGAPTFESIYEKIVQMLEGEFVINHGSFDRSSLKRATELHGLEEITNYNCIDTTRVIRRTWEQFRSNGYGLENMAEYLLIDYRHHDALEDAIVTGKIFIEAMKIKEMNPKEWFIRSRQPISHVKGNRVHSDKFDIPETNIEGPLYGEFIVFTGTLSMTKKEAAEYASQAGCAFQRRVNKDTTILVVGDQDVRQLKEGETKSLNHKNAEAKMLKGQRIRIIGEEDFMNMLKDSNGDQKMDKAIS